MYHYANNNPIKYSDPDGKIAFCAVTAIIGGVVGGGLAAYNSYKETGKVDGWRVVRGAAVGAAVGLGIGLVGAQAATSTALQAGNCLASFGEVTGWGMAVTGGAGAATAGGAAAATNAVGTEATGININLYDEAKTLTHIFSKDHISSGLMKLGNSTKDIFNTLKNCIQNIDINKVSEGSNEFRTAINGIDTTIRFYVRNGEVVNMDAFTGYSDRIIGNLVQ